MIRGFGDKQPQLAQGVFVADTALVLGDVELGQQSSIWYGSVVRGDVHSIRIGEATNIQDRCVVHVTHGTHHTVVGDQVTVGHGAILHGCTVGDRCLVGMGAILLDGVELGPECLVAAGALLPPGKVYPARSMIVGAPATIKGEVSDDEVQWILKSAKNYTDLAQQHWES